MTRLVIINHDDHCVYIEDVTDETLAKYNGEEQAYIDDNYNIENYSWDYITNVYYIGQGQGDPDPREIDFNAI